MAIRTILTKGDPALNKMCHPVTKFDQKLWELLDDLKETLAKANGLGLAAPQVGILRRAVIVVNDDGEMLELVNPEIVDQKGEQDGLEGCLSVPGLWGYVKRPAWVKVRPRTGMETGLRWRDRNSPPAVSVTKLSHLDGHLYTELTDKLYTNEDLDQMMSEEEQEERG